MGGKPSTTVKEKEKQNIIKMPKNSVFKNRKKIEKDKKLQKDKNIININKTVKQKKIENKFNLMRKMTENVENNINDNIKKNQNSIKNSIVVSKFGNILKNVDINIEDDNGEDDANISFEINNNNSNYNIINNINNNNNLIDENNNDFEISFDNNKIKTRIYDKDTKDNLIDKKINNKQSIISNIETNITNIIFSLTLPTSKINEFTQIYLNNKSINYIDKYELNNQSIFIYHIKINEQMHLKHPEKGEIKPYFIRNKLKEYNYYYCDINYFYCKNNFFYDLDWKMQEKNKSRIEFNMNTIDRVYITKYFILYLEKLKEDKIILQDFITNQLDELNLGINISFTEFLLLLIKSIQLKEEILFKKCLNMLKNESEFKYENAIDKLIISENDILKYLFNEEEIKNSQILIDNNDDETKNSLNKIKINILMRYFKKKFEKYLDENIKDEKVINTIFEVLQINGKYQQGIYIQDKILNKLIKIANNKEKIKILYSQCNTLIDFLIVNITNYNLISALFNNDSIKVIDYIDKKSLNNDSKTFTEFFEYLSK